MIILSAVKRVDNSGLREASREPCWKAGALIQARCQDHLDVVITRRAEKGWEGDKKGLVDYSKASGLRKSSTEMGKP